MDKLLARICSSYLRIFVHDVELFNTCPFRYYLNSILELHQGKIRLSFIPKFRVINNDSENIDANDGKNNVGYKQRRKIV